MRPGKIRTERIKSRHQDEKILANAPECNIIRTFPSFFFHYFLKLRYVLQLLLLHQLVVKQERVKKLYEITESSKMKGIK